MTEQGGGIRQVRPVSCDLDPKSGLPLFDSARFVSDTNMTVERLLCPLPAPPPAVHCIGLNYRQHAAEVNMEVPRFPVVLMKNPSALTGPEDEVVIPRVAHDPPEVDFEAELAVVIGPSARGPCKDVGREHALEHVHSFTVVNDVSARRWQGKKGGGQWCRSKSFDTFLPLGPTLVAPTPCPEANSLRIQSWVNKELMQDSSTADMVFDVASLIQFLSEDTTLLPGTVIATGTPEGVGYTRRPARYLSDGDLVEVQVEGIGRLSNWVRNKV